MTAAAADRNTPDWGVRKVVRHDVAASTKIYGGTMVCLDASGNANDGAATAGFRFAGVSRGDPINGTSTADNSSGSAGDKKVEVYTSGCFEFVGASLTKADIGKPMWLSDDQTVTTTPGLVFVGILKDIVSATQPIIDIEPAVQGSDRGERGGAMFPMTFTSNATVTGAVQSKLEFPFRAAVKRWYADVLTAPGSTDTATCTITDGTGTITATITGAAVQNEDEAVTVVFLANTDISVTFARSGSTAATMTIVLWVVPL